MDTNTVTLKTIYSKSKRRARSLHRRVSRFMTLATSINSLPCLQFTSLRLGRINGHFADNARIAPDIFFARRGDRNLAQQFLIRHFLPIIINAVFLLFQY